MDLESSGLDALHDADLHANVSSQAFAADALLAASVMGAVWALRRVGSLASRWSRPRR